MTPKTNNNDGKNLSKTIAMAGMGFLLIAAAFTFSFANSGQQLVNAQEGGNATTTIVATPFDTFTGDGVITATIQEEGGGGGGNETAEQQAAATKQQQQAAATKQQQQAAATKQQEQQAAATKQQQQAAAKRDHTS